MDSFLFFYSTIVKDSKKNNIYQVFIYIRPQSKEFIVNIYDFNSNSLIFADSQYSYYVSFNMYTPMSLLNSASGTLINGKLDGITMWTSRKRRDLGEVTGKNCEIMCQGANPNNPMLANIPGNNLFEDSWYQSCLVECNKNF